jgi:PAS domain S-box-containing protein
MPWAVAGLYAAASATWIVFSDRLLLGLSDSIAHYQQLQTWKGTAFVAGSALLILAMLSLAVRRIAAAYDTLQDGEERLRLALRCAGGGAWEIVAGPTGPRFTYFSPELLARIGLPSDRPPTWAEWQARVHPDDFRHSRDLLQQMVAGPPGVEVTTTLRVVAADGATFWFEAHASRAPCPEGAQARIVGVGLDVTRRVRAEHRVDELLRYDSATGLAKPAQFTADLSLVLAAAPEGSLVGVFRVRPRDLDPAASDNAEALVALADRLKRLRVGHHLIARLSNDVFAVATPPVADLRAVHDHLGQMLDHLGAHDRDAGFAVGAAVFPGDGRTPEALIGATARALAALGPGTDTRVLWFTDGLDEQYRRHATLMRDLRRAVGNGEILCHYQPLVDLTTGGVAGFEALARWRTKDGTILAPAAFIALAERTGDIRAIGETVLHQACEAAMGWRAKAGAAPFVAVNVSPVQLADPRFPLQVARILTATGLDPARLELEITESVLAVDLDAAARRLADLRALGVSIAIDDFGTGYSSLSLLGRLPFTRLKIDRSFVVDPGDGAVMLETIAGLARRLHLATTAEGIETPEQVLRVAGNGVDIGQGYHFSRPVPREEADALVDAVWSLTPESRAVVA